jgi:uncharacterized protein YwqG
MEAKLQSIKVAYFRLKDQMYGLSLKPRSQKKAFNASYNKVIPLKKEFLQARDSQVNMQTEIATTQAELFVPRKRTSIFRQSLSF